MRIDSKFFSVRRGVTNYVFKRRVKDASLQGKITQVRGMSEIVRETLDN